jgi:hypothetical protein
MVGSPRGRRREDEGAPMKSGLRTTRTGQSALLLLDAADVLAREGLDYVVVGAFALAVHGTIRGTTDADTVVRASARCLKRAAPVFADAGFRVAFRPGDADDPVPALLQLNDTHGNCVISSQVCGGWIQARSNERSACRCAKRRCTSRAARI